jgi:hypothetical protein
VQGIRVNELGTRGLGSDVGGRFYYWGVYGI